MLAKPLTKIGNSQCVVLDKSVLALVGAEDPDTVFKVTVEGNKIVLEVMSQDERDKLVMKAAGEQMKIHSKVLKKLAK